MSAGQGGRLDTEKGRRTRPGSEGKEQQPKGSKWSRWAADGAQCGNNDQLYYRNVQGQMHEIVAQARSPRRRRSFWCCDDARNQAGRGLQAALQVRMNVLWVEKEECPSPLST